MQLKIGTRLGHYDVLSAIAAGGMGEVYEARDTRLDRRVAVKILPTSFAADPQRRLRFEREAKVISSLNHPNICTLHDIGEQDGVHFLVMELIEGESLADRLSDGPLSVRNIATWGAQIADALERAHRQNIVHRDLKPGNIMITKSGAKVLDFGLAHTNDSGITHDADTHTWSDPLTREGAIVGTYQYMAPEQLQGMTADRRTDIFALGLILYEMATGRRPFAGDSRASLTAATLTADPAPVSELRPGIPPLLARVITHCLAKDPDDRWQTAHDIALQLRTIPEGAPESHSAAMRSGRTKERVTWMIAIAILLGTGIVALSRLRQQNRHTHGLHLAVPVNQGFVVRATTDQIAEISPDGRRIAYTALDAEGISQLFVRDLRHDEADLLAGTAGAYNPFFSPDGRWVAFFRSSRLQKISLDGGAPIDLAIVGPSRGGTWAKDGFIYYSPRSNSSLWRVSSEGGHAEEITRLDKTRGESSHRWPQVTSDGTHVVFTIKTDRISSFDQAEIALLSLETRKWKSVLEGTFGRYLPSGHLIFLRGGGMQSVRFNLAGLEVRGVAVPLIQHLAHDPSTGVAQFSVSTNGILAFIPGGGTQNDDELIWVDRQGRATPAGSQTGTFAKISLSPDRRRVVMSVAAANDDLWMYDLEKDQIARFSFEPGDELFPIWSPDGNDVIFTSQSSLGTRLLIKSADGTSESRELRRSSQPLLVESVSPDGKLLVFAQNREAQKGFFLNLLGLDQLEMAPVPFVTTASSEQHARFSPAGGLLAYVSDESGRDEVYVRAVQGEGKWQISTDGGIRPEWSPDGSELFYASDSKLYAIAVTTSRFSAGKRTLLFDRPYFECYTYVPLEDRFLMCRSASVQPAIGQLNLITDWFDEVEAKTK